MPRSAVKCPCKWPPHACDPNGRRLTAPPFWYFANVSPQHHRLHGTGRRRHAAAAQSPAAVAGRSRRRRGGRFVVAGQRRPADDDDRCGRATAPPGPTDLSARVEPAQLAVDDVPQRADGDERRQWQRAQPGRRFDARQSAEFASDVQASEGNVFEGGGRQAGASTAARAGDAGGQRVGDRASDEEEEGQEVATEGLEVPVTQSARYRSSQYIIYQLLPNLCSLFE